MSELLKQVKDNNVKKVREYLDNGRFPDDYGDSVLHVTPLMIAAENGNLEIVKLLIEHGSDPNARQQAGGHNALINAIHGQHLEVVKYLLENHADPEVKENGIAAISVAPYRGNLPR